ncbi:MAG TPA: cyclic nucleotide-binding domain-containing protein [Candidatus Dormibacteraeota bacterium]|nr:cyclic nucleotide-binding domain-containing protein [Candidatus Dormibacteraeota bacterium]
MGKDERISRLRSVPLFSGCTDKQLAFIATRVEELDFPTGKVLCEEGKSGGDFFIVLSGTADVRRRGNTMNRMGPGDFFGEIALLDQGPRSATVVTTAPMRALVLGPAQFQDVLFQDSEIARQMLYAVTKRLRATGAAAD